MRRGSSFISELVAGLTVHSESIFNHSAERPINVVLAMGGGGIFCVRAGGKFRGEGCLRENTKRKYSGIGRNSVYFTAFGITHAHPHHL